VLIKIVKLAANVLILITWKFAKQVSQRRCAPNEFCWVGNSGEQWLTIAEPIDWHAILL